MSDLTLRQRAIVRWLAVNQPATYRELGDGVGLLSTKTVFDYVRNLEYMGIIVRAGRRKFPQKQQSRCLSLAAGIVVSERGWIGRLSEVLT